MVLDRATCGISALENILIGMGWNKYEVWYRFKVAVPQ